MEFLISLYDNALIYYPNIFFAVLFFVSILGIVLIVMGIVVLGRKVRKFIEAIASSLKQGKVKEKKAISPVYVVKFLTISFVRVANVVFIQINTALGYIESQAEKIIKKIGKEILIEE